MIQQTNYHGVQKMLLTGDDSWFQCKLPDDADFAVCLEL